MAPYKLSESIYPISFEQALIQSFFFYSQTPIYLIYLAFIMFFSMLPFYILENVVKKKQLFNNPFIDKLEQVYIKIFSYFRKNKELFVIPGTIFVLVYLILITSLLVLAPYKLAIKDYSKKLTYNLKQFDPNIIKGELSLNDIFTIEIMNKGISRSYEGIIIKQSEQMVSFLTKNGMSTYPMAHVVSIKYPLPIVKKQKQ
jgi:hypothetical protein